MSFERKGLFSTLTPFFPSTSLRQTRDRPKREDKGDGYMYFSSRGRRKTLELVIFPLPPFWHHYNPIFFFPHSTTQQVRPLGARNYISLFYVCARRHVWHNADLHLSMQLLKFSEGRCLQQIQCTSCVPFSPTGSEQ